MSQPQAGWTVGDNREPLPQAPHSLQTSENRSKAAVMSRRPR